MGKNVKGGKKHKRGKKVQNEVEDKYMVFKEEGQVYGKVIKLLGNCRLLAKCYLETGGTLDLMCMIPGKFRKRTWINIDDIVLVGIRDFQSGKADIMYKYSSQEAKQLLSHGELPADAQVGRFGGEETKDEYTGFDFFSTGKTDLDEEKPTTKSKINIDESMLPPSGSEEEDEEGGFHRNWNHNTKKKEEVFEINLEDL